MILSTMLAGSIFLDQFLVTAGFLAGAGLIWLIVRGANQRQQPFDEVAKLVLRNEVMDLAWIETLRQQQQAANKSTLRTWRQNACAVWIFLAALIIKLGYLAFGTLVNFLERTS